MLAYAAKETRKIELCLLFFTNSLENNKVHFKKKTCNCFDFINCFAQLTYQVPTYTYTLRRLEEKVVGNSHRYFNEVFSV